MVDESLSAVASSILDVVFGDGADGGQRIGVVAEKVAQVEGVGNGLVDSNGKTRLGASGDLGVDLHFVDAHFDSRKIDVVVLVWNSQKNGKSFFCKPKKFAAKRW